MALTTIFIFGLFAIIFRIAWLIDDARDRIEKLERRLDGR